MPATSERKEISFLFILNDNY